MNTIPFDQNDGRRNAGKLPLIDNKIDPVCEGVLRAHRGLVSGFVGGGGEYDPADGANHGTQERAARTAKGDRSFRSAQRFGNRRGRRHHEREGAGPMLPREGERFRARRGPAVKIPRLADQTDEALPGTARFQPQEPSHGAPMVGQGMQAVHPLRREERDAASAEHLGRALRGVLPRRPRRENGAAHRTLAPVAEADEAVGHPVLFDRLGPALKAGSLPALFLGAEQQSAPGVGHHRS